MEIGIVRGPGQRGDMRPGGLVIGQREMGLARPE